MRLNRQRKELGLKIVYYGPGLSGKTTNLVQLHAAYPAGRRGGLITLDTETERTLFFDYFPLDFGTFVVGTFVGWRVKIDFFTVPGQSFYQATRRAVLEGADGVVFVADSSPNREHANLVSREDLCRSLAEASRALEHLPHVYQWNKRDLPGALPLSMLARQLNPEGAPAVEAVASAGQGVWETQALIVREVLRKLQAMGRRQEAKGA